MEKRLNTLKNVLAAVLTAAGTVALSYKLSPLLFPYAWYLGGVSGILGGVMLWRWDAIGDWKRYRASKQPQETFPLSDEQSRYSRSVAAWHEAGHVIASAYAHDGRRRVLSAQIWSDKRGNFSGRVTFTPNRTNANYHEMCFYLRRHLAGKAAEELALKVHGGDNGGDNDMWHATWTARNMVARYGMSKTFGRMRYDLSAESLPHDLAMQVHTEASRILDEQMTAVKALLNERKAELQSIAGELYRHGYLNEKRIAELLAPSTAPS